MYMCRSSAAVLPPARCQSVDAYITSQRQAAPAAAADGAAGAGGMTDGINADTPHLAHTSPRPAARARCPAGGASNYQPPAVPPAHLPVCSKSAAADITGPNPVFPHFGFLQVVTPCGGQFISGVKIFRDTGHDTIRYDTRGYFNVRSKADMSRLNLPHGNDNYRRPHIGANGVS